MARLAGGWNRHASQLVSAPETRHLPPDRHRQHACSGREDSVIKSILTASIAITAALALSACMSEGTNRNTTHLDVSAAPSANQCSPTSPELQVYGTPHGAMYYRVRLMDLSDPGGKHGEAEVSVNPSGIIPAGAIKDDYTPPCPGTGGHSYQYQVHAVDNLGHVLGTGGYTVTM
jgi:hypothetical protein